MVCVGCGRRWMSRLTQVLAGRTAGFVARILSWQDGVQVEQGRRTLVAGGERLCGAHASMLVGVDGMNMAVMPLAPAVVSETLAACV